MYLICWRSSDGKLRLICHFLFIHSAFGVTTYHSWQEMKNTVGNLVFVGLGSNNTQAEIPFADLELVEGAFDA